MPRRLGCEIVAEQSGSGTLVRYAMAMAALLGQPLHLVNARRRPPPQEVANAYWRAWELGLKGITIYRYGSKV